MEIKSNRKTVLKTMRRLANESVLLKYFIVNVYRQYG